uniref:(northern house mosquito) hypothetical protein n=1 Tax=Culex pipiens TaxID=7175 RepID=A0A8D8F662_CULPI
MFLIGLLRQQHNQQIATLKHFAPPIEYKGKTRNIWIAISNRSPSRCRHSGAAEAALHGQGPDPAVQHEGAQAAEEAQVYARSGNGSQLAAAQAVRHRGHRRRPSPLGTL